MTERAAFTNPIPVRALGVRAEIDAAIDIAEHIRRGRYGLVGVDDEVALDVLGCLPVQMPVHRDSLTDREMRAIRRLPPGCVRSSGDVVVREIVAPVAIREAFVRRRDWRRAINEATRFAPYCKRTAVVTGDIDDAEIAAAEAAYWEVGLVLERPGVVPRLLSPPTPTRPRPLTTMSWRLREVIYRAAISEGVALDPEPQELL